MKKVTSIFLLLLFLIANSGIAINVHWCGGKLSSVDFFADGGNKCKCGKKAMKPNCCKDKTSHFKANDELSKTSHFAFKISIPTFLFTLIKHIEAIPSIHFQYAASPFYYPPPLKPKSPIYLLDGAFLI